jgi:hypothetical protein
MSDRPKSRERADHAAGGGGCASQTDSSPSDRELTRGSQGELFGSRGRATRLEAPFDGKAVTGGHLVELALNDGYRDEDDREETDRELPRSSFHREGRYAACGCATPRVSCSLSLTIR